MQSSSTVEELLARVDAIPAGQGSFQMWVPSQLTLRDETVVCELAMGFLLDRIVGKGDDGRRAGAAMVNNTVGILPRETPDAPIRFVAGKQKDGAPAAVFLPAEGGGWFWPQAAIYSRDHLFVFLAHIEKTAQPGAFGFKQIGQWLGVIDNPFAEPTGWRIAQQPVPFAEFSDEQEKSWGSAVVIDSGHVYIYGTLDRRKVLGSRQLLLARASVEKLDDFAAWQFRTADDWSAAPAEAAP